MLRKILILLFATISTMTYAQNGNELPFQKWALTPPMGWNSWDCFGPSVVEDEVKANADYMAANLKDYGWEYIVVDIRWYVDNQTTGYYNAFGNSDFVYDQYGRYLPSPTRFPSSVNGNGFKPLADYIHNLGLKFGIHIMRGVPKVAVNNNLPIKDVNGKTAADIYSTAYECTWLKDNWTIDYTKTGAQEYYNSIFELYGQWGVDFIKIDDLSRPYHDKEIEMIRNAIDRTGRPMVLSMSPGATPLNQHDHAKNNANMWRTVDDFWDNWSQLNYSFGICANWAPYISPGGWPDADMLPLGHIAIRGERGVDRYTNFTEDEQYTLMSLWTMFKSPLMFGGHLPDNDAFTNALITNPQVLDVHKYSVNNQEWFNDNGKIAWVADDPENGDKYVGLFNTGGNQFVDTQRLLYRSGIISELTDGYGTNIDVNIPKGSKSLYLIVDDGGDNYDYDHADWINPTIYLDDNTTIKLTDLTWEYATAGWNSVQINKSISGGTLNVNGTEYSNGLGTHSKSIILYEIPDNTVRFTAFGGLDFGGTSQPSTPTVEFMVSDEDPTTRDVNVNNAIANSGRISRTIQQTGKTITADITGASKLYLVVTDAGDNYNYDHGDWINPTISKSTGETLSLTSLNWVSATSGWSTVKKNASIDNNPLTVNSMTYSEGFGVNAYSIIEFDLPPGFVTFTSFCGFDDEVLNAPDGVTMEFMVFTTDPKKLDSSQIPVDLTLLGFSGDCTIQDLWDKINMGTFANSDFSPQVVSHGAELYRISAVNRSNNVSITLDGPSQVTTGENVTLNMNVTTGTDTPEGYIMLYMNGEFIGTLKIDSVGNATYNISFPTNDTYVFEAKYSGNQNYQPKASDQLSINSTTLSVDDPLKKNKLKVFHSSIDQKTYLTGTEIGDQVEIYNILGQKITSFTTNSSIVPISYFKGLAIIKVKNSKTIVTLKTVL